MMRQFLASVAKSSMLDWNRALFTLELDRKMRDAEVSLHALVDVAQHVGGFAQAAIV
jgi:hypothetical protein